MRKIIINKIFKYLNFFYKYTDEEKEKIQYGLEVLLISSLKLIILIIISLIFNFFKETVLVIISVYFIRKYSYGIHMNKIYKCYILTILILFIIPYFFINIDLSIIARIMLHIFSFISIILWCPADTKNRPLINKNKRELLKFKTACIALIYTYISLKFNHIIIKNTLTYSLIIESLLINPLTYKLFNIPYNNYKYIEISK